MKRFFDLTLALLSIPILLLPGALISLSIILTSKGPSIHWSNRVGRNKQIFKMPKYRTMRIDTPQKATHLLEDPDLFITPIGSLLRKTSLDELPQIWSILKGEMSFVGPRPALFNQEDLIQLREQRGINSLVPGLTGWAQINGRDELSISDKVELESEYFKKQSLLFDIVIIAKTIINAFKSKEISH
ncbi:sugar transferase [Gammaproteobacteria bacterium]|nr:sugar transferase [Gammaproteobacteria bacterium]